MEYARDQLYLSADAFFRVGRINTMKLSPDAAIAVCVQAAERGLLISRIEGGIWHGATFEARLDCIWDGRDPPIKESEAALNNARAADFIRGETSVHNAFVIT